MKVITLPNGHRTSLGTYAKSWRAIKQKPDSMFSGFCHFPERGHCILQRMREGLHDRINQHLPYYGKGRKWDPDWQRITGYSAILLNSRTIIDYLPPHLKPRFQSRLRHAA